MINFFLLPSNKHKMHLLLSHLQFSGQVQFPKKMFALTMSPSFVLRFHGNFIYPLSGCDYLVCVCLCNYIRKSMKRAFVAFFRYAFWYGPLNMEQSEFAEWINFWMNERWIISRKSQNYANIQDYPDII